MRFLSWLAAIAAAFLILVFLARAAEPIGTDDLFWHLALGRHVLDTGVVLQTDIFSHTAHGRPDVPQQWLAEVIYALVDRLAAATGLRVLAGTILAGCVATVVLLLTRARAGLAATSAGVALFLILGWWWLLQLRPHGFSMIALFLFAVLIEGRLDEKRSLALVLLTLFWVNVHAVGLLAPIAASGIVAVELFARFARAEDAEPARAARLFLALLATSFLTPSGAALWDFAFGHRGDLLTITDEWSRLRLFSRTQDFVNMAGPVHAAALVALAVFALGALAALSTTEGRARLVAQRRRAALALFGAALGLSAVRFLFALVLPVAWAAGELEAHFKQRLAVARAGLAALVVAAMGWAYVAHLDARMFHADSFEEWRQPRLEKKLFPELTRFLAETGIEGDLYNSYHVGGQLLLALHPRCRVFVDARTVVYGAKIIGDADLIARGRDAKKLLDAYGVDVFVGNGFLGVPNMSYETLAHDPEWLQVFRSQEAVVRLRRSAKRTAANLERVASWYQREGVPFDEEKGFDPALATPDWAARWRVLPRELVTPLVADAPVLDRAQRAFGLGIAWGRLGAWSRAIASLEQADALMPHEKEVKRALDQARAAAERR